MKPTAPGARRPRPARGEVPPRADAEAGDAWRGLALTPALRRAVADEGFTAPAPIQAAVLPAARAGRDLIASAPTGSGKTAAYALAALQRLDVWRPAWRRTYVLVLVPTRELAVQVGAAFRALGRYLADPVKVAMLFGGVSVNPQMLGLRGGSEVVVATPGRLLDLIDRRAVTLDDVELLVLDEADRLLDEGFADEINRLTALMPARRQSLCFSATFAPPVQALARSLLRDAVRVDLTGSAGAAQAAADPGGASGSVQPDDDRTSPEAPGERGNDKGVAQGADEGVVMDAALDGPPAIEQHAVAVDAPRRTALLRHMIEQGHWSRVLVFVATRYASEHVADKLRRAGLAAAAFHGELSQGARTRTLAEFRGGALQVLLATDIAARGLHIPDLPVVVNYDLPRSAEDYTHRVGRTARAGATGLAVSFVSADREAHFRLIEKRQGLRVPRERIAGFEPREVPAATPGAAAPDGGGIKGRRRSRKDKLREAAARTGSGGE